MLKTLKTGLALIPCLILNQPCRGEILISHIIPSAGLVSTGPISLITIGEPVVFSAPLSIPSLGFPHTLPTRDLFTPMEKAALAGFVSVSLSGESKVKGDVLSNGSYTGSGKSHVQGSVSASSITLSGKSSISGDQTVIPAQAGIQLPILDLDFKRLQSEALSQTPLIPEGFIQQGILVLGRHDTLILTTGTYAFSGIALSGKARLLANGPVFIFCSGHITLKGNSSVNPSITRDLLILSDSTATFKFTGESSFKGYIYAPQASVELSGDFSMRGYLWSGAAALSGSSVIESSAPVSPLPDLEGRAKVLSPVTPAEAGVQVLTVAFNLHEAYVYPNPAKGGENPILRVNVSGATRIEARVYNAAGEPVLEKTLDESIGDVYESPITESLPSGVYLYVVEARGQDQTARAMGRFSVLR